MLFDLRGRGRRRTIKIVYITLALLMGGGLVLFGIGGGGAMQGGLVDAITGTSGGRHRQRALREGREGAAAATRLDAKDAAAWAALARARVQIAGIGDNFDPNSAPYTESGKAKLTQAADAWDKYLALEPKNPDDRVASLMVRAFDQTGLNRPADAAAAQEIITEARPGATTYATLAIYAYQAGQTRKGDLAREKALDARPRTSATPSRTSSTRRSSRPPPALQQDQGRRRPPRPPRQEEQVASPAPRALATIGTRALVAQLAEQRTLNPKVPGSIPGGGT